MRTPLLVSNVIASFLNSVWHLVVTYGRKALKMAGCSASLGHEVQNIIIMLNKVFNEFQNLF
ncbi:hypothetical protein NH00_24600 [Enterobacter cancerogenus]|nr:hypothetical protein NH00_24600 [Enterobacter cancerogenus]